MAAKPSPAVDSKEGQFAWFETVLNDSTDRLEKLAEQDRPSWYYEYVGEATSNDR